MNLMTFPQERRGVPRDESGTSARCGFTLFEVVLATSLLALIVSFLVPVLHSSRWHLRADSLGIRSALEEIADTPEQLEALVETSRPHARLHDFPELANVRVSLRAPRDLPAPWSLLVLEKDEVRVVRFVRNEESELGEADGSEGRPGGASSRTSNAQSDDPRDGSHEWQGPDRGANP